MFTNPGVTFVILGAIVLCHGAEAFTPTHGSLRHQTIRLAWFSVVMPALVLNYFGQVRCC
jgi:KUP system potassium uptake protein